MDRAADHRAVAVHREVLALRGQVHYISMTRATKPHYRRGKEKRMALSDRLGLAVSTSSSEALTAYEQGLDLALRWRSGAMDALHAAVVSEPHFTLAHCTKAYVGLRMGQVDTALEAHQQALAQQDSVQTER